MLGDVFDVFFSFFQNISYVKHAFENQFRQLKRNKNSYRILHFLKNKICAIGNLNVECAVILSIFCNTDNIEVILNQK